MSGRLVGEVVDWLCTPAAGDLTLAERAVLLIIAERAHEQTRKMWRHGVDDCTLFERLCHATGLDRAGLTAVLKRLAKRDLEVRVQIGETKNGRPVYAHRGKAMGFELPVLPASVQLPERVDEGRPITPGESVDNPGDNGAETPPADAERVDADRPIDPKGSTGIDAMTPKGSMGIDPYPSKDIPSKEDPSSPLDLSSTVTVEGAAPAAAPAEQTTSHHMGWNQDYRAASTLLQTLPDLGGSYMAAAEAALPAGTRMADRVIYAAQLARKAAAS